MAHRDHRGACRNWRRKHLPLRCGECDTQELAVIIAKSRELGYEEIELDARQALAEIEIKVGQMAAERTHLATIEADARAKGYILVARKAAIARG
jgi:hypothetical protein